VNQLKGQLSKFHMPEYIKKVRLEYEEKLLSTDKSLNNLADLERELLEAE
jgi:hypothetical protein